MINRIVLLLAATLLCVDGIAQELKVTNKLTDVTVYRNMAKETRAGAITIPAGTTDIYFPGVTTMMNDMSLQIAAKGDAVLLAAGVRINHNVEELSSEKQRNYNAYQDSIKEINRRLNWIQQETSVYEGEMGLVENLLHIAAPKENYKPEELNQMAEIYRSRIMELKKRLFQLQNTTEKYRERSSHFQNLCNEMGNRKSSPTKEIVLTFFSEKESFINVKTTYLVNGATWVPLYDVNVESISQPVNLTYKASITQSTGMDWKDVAMSVSTANPSFNNNRPIMQPKYIDYVAYRVTENFYSNSASNMMQVQNDVFTPQPNLPQPANVVESDLMVEFELSNRQSIPADGKAHVCKLTEYKVPATYRYHVVAKLDPAAFLLARITDYGKYNLLDGSANVFFGDMYVGQVQLNPQTTSDTLLLSLGRDEKIVVKRCRVTNTSGKKVLSGVETEEFVYEIKVRNNKSVAIDIEVLDQIPLTRRKEIIVKVDDEGGANYNKEYGKLLWNFKLPANSDKALRFGYKVEYPAGKQVAEQ
jgi:uncharacterized protein (TIGR02231 family)